MLPHQQRVVDEHAELETKRAALRSFLDTSDMYATLPVAEQARLHLQHAIMQDYSNVLALRISWFEEENAKVPEVVTAEPVKAANTATTKD